MFELVFGGQKRARVTRYPTQPMVRLKICWCLSVSKVWQNIRNRKTYHWFSSIFKVTKKGPGLHAILAGRSTQNSGYTLS